eukprot:scaffold9178_cov176-Amphora_coffeaeformis.AAC.23
MFSHWSHTVRSRLVRNGSFKALDGKIHGMMQGILLSDKGGQRVTENPNIGRIGLASLMVMEKGRDEKLSTKHSQVRMNTVEMKTWGATIVLLGKDPQGNCEPNS